MAFVTEDRKRDGLALDLLRHRQRRPRFHGSRPAPGHARSDGTARDVVRDKLDELRVRPRGVDRPVRQLSGGNQQKVVLAKWLLVDNVRIFIFDEPTRGVDIATKVEIYRMMAELAAAGMAILLISSEMPEVLGMSDRVLVMRGGRIAAELDRDEFTMETVFAHAAGDRRRTGMRLGRAMAAMESRRASRRHAGCALRSGQRRLRGRHRQRS